MALAALAACAEEHPTAPREATPPVPALLATAAGGDSYAYVANTVAPSVSVIRTLDHSVIATVPLDRAPISVAVSPDGAFVYVLKFEGTEIGVIETARLLADPTHPAAAVVGTFEIQIVAPGFRGGSSLLVSPNGEFVYVTGAESGPSSILVLRTAKLLADRANALAAKLAIGAYELGMAISPNGAFLYVTFGRLCCSAAGLAVIRTSDNTRVATVDGVVGTVEVTPNGVYVYVAGAGFSSNQLVVIRTSDNTLAHQMVIDGLHSDVAITPDGAYAYVTTWSCGAPGQVVAIRTSDNAVVAKVVVPGSPTAVAVTPDGAFAYAARNPGCFAAGGGGTVSVIRTLSNTEVATVPVGVEGAVLTNVAMGTIAPTVLPATITLSGLGQVYDGSAKAATATTDPAGLEGVALTYDGSPIPPRDVGSYTVMATLTNPEYEAPDATGTLVIQKGSATITLANLAHTFDGAAKAARASTDPDGLTGVTLSYSQNSAPVSSPVNAGTYNVLAQLSNPNYKAADAAGTLTIQPATPTISWADPSAITAGTPLSGTQLNATALGVGAVGLTGTFNYTPAAGTVLDPGPAQQLSVNFVPSDPNYTRATKTVHIAVRYTFTSFRPPVDNPGPNGDVVNRATAGSGIPVKFSLGGDQRLAIFLAGYPKFVPSACDGSDTQDAIETTTTNPAGLSYVYDGGTNTSNYEYVWKTQKAWAGRCGTFQLGLKDGSDHHALFTFTK